MHSFSTTFYVVFSCSFLWALIQIATAYKSGWFSQKQMRQFNHRGYAILEHGGIWADIFFLSLAMGIMVSGYKLGYLTKSGLAVFIPIVVYNLWQLKQYENAGIVMPEAHTHYGHTPITGWIHIFYAIWVMWTLVLFYFTTHVSIQDLLSVTILFTLWAPLGMVKFNKNWRWTRPNTWQAVGLITAFWLIAGIKIYIQQ